MKVLLLGEYSSLHKNLKDGLVEYGCDVTLAGYGDGFKKIKMDLSFDSNLPFGFDRLYRKISPLLGIDKLYGHDVVQIMNPFIFYNYFPAHYFHSKIFKNNSKAFLLGAGDDAYFWRRARKKLNYGPFDDFLKYDLKSDSFFMESDIALKHNDFVLENVLKIIPIMYEYQAAYDGNPKLSDVIPIPINLKKIQYQDNIIEKKLVVFHGLNRYGFKGTRHVEKAFEYLRMKYPNDLELIIDGGMPIDQYLDVMRRTNVVIDQTNSYSCGVNAIYALAMGKVVLGGAEPESLKALKVDKSPVINIKPDFNEIVKAIENLLEKRKQILSIGYESRLFAEKNHCHLKVAEKYIKEWQCD